MASLIEMFEKSIVSDTRSKVLRRVPPHISHLLWPIK